MKVIDETILSVKSAKFAGGYRVRLSFNNGIERVVDFSSFLLNSKNPLIRKYLDPAQFKSFSIDGGDLQWNDYDLCFPIADLYEGEIG